MGTDRMIGMGVRLSKTESKRLDALARATGRSKGSVIRALVRLAQPRDLDMLTLLRNTQNELEAEDANW